MSGVPPGVSLRSGTVRTDQLPAEAQNDAAEIADLTARIVVLEASAADFESRIAALEAA